MSKRSTINDDGMEKPAAVPSLSPFSSSNEIALKVMSIMKEAYGALPVEFFGLSRSADLLAPRGLIVSKESYYLYKERGKGGGGKYPIVSIRVKWWSPEGPLIVVPGVKTVTVESLKFNSEVVLCEGVEQITFTTLSNFKHPITLPEGMRKAVFGFSFNKSLILPASLEELLLGFEYDQPVDLRTAPRLRVIKFGARFNRMVELTDSLEEVTFSSPFNQPLYLPANLRKLTLGVSFNHPITVPPRLEELYFQSEHGKFNHPLTLPEGSSIKKLVLSDKFNHPIGLIEGLESIEFGGDFNFPLHHVPSTLRELYFTSTSDFNQAIELPSGLKSIRFGDWMEHDVILPLGLEKLEWYSPILVNLPDDGLLEVTFGEMFEHPLILPLSLKRITLHREYSLPLVLPPGCERLALPEDYT